ncbi:quinoprotein relay system zinc metallohydrolase 2 [Variovorax rhizosphaerae]|uniref:Quinoprotein relay system zinc metallohydrolase 2 n=1 Tax=Variovorax rhizosphaerae TaxID=1836200 RepID=A0ABU8WSR9_9BURK
MPTRRWPRGLWLAMFLCAANAGAQAADPVAPLAVVEVKPGVFAHAGKLEDWAPANGGDVANLGFVVGSRCVAVIDTGGTPAIGQALKAAIDRATTLPVCYVINTHAHPDHVLGNAAFVDAYKPAPRFVASARFAQALTAREPYWLNSLKRDFGLTVPRTSIVYPGNSVDKSMDLDLGGRVLTLQAWPTAHTDNDLTVYDQRTRTLFAGDLLFVRHLPALDGNLRGWTAVMEDLRRLPVDAVVPGHGPVSTDWPGVMDAQANYLGALLRDTRAALRKHLTIQQAVDSIGIAPGTTWLLTDRFHKRNVTAAYAELEWEDPDPTDAPKATKP